MIKTNRVYDPPAKADGFRILVDRLWPRGLTKARAKVDLWLRDIAPSDGLRKRFGHDPRRWKEFRRDYAKELKGKADALREIGRLEREKGTVTLLFSAKDEAHNNVVVLREALMRRTAA